ncbi:hypothetical protein PTI98_009383 [Pleurotus ostreatus]|nr:hypothetical protein PTI98_009383 [Pleurotus ostreatus]
MASLLPFAQVLDKFPSLLSSDALQLPPPVKIQVESDVVSAESPSELSSLLSEFELGHFILDLNYAQPHPDQRPLIPGHVQQFVNDIESGLLGPYHQNSPLLVIAQGPCPIVTGPGIWSHPIVDGKPVEFLVIAGQHRLAAICASNLWLKHWKCLVYRRELLDLSKPRTMELYMAQINERQTALENSDDVLLPSVINVLMACYSHGNRNTIAAKTIRSFPNRGYLNFILRMPAALRPLRDLLITCPDFAQSSKFDIMMKELGASRNPELVAMILETCKAHGEFLSTGAILRLERLCNAEDTDQHWGNKRSLLRTAWYASDAVSWNRVFSGVVNKTLLKSWVEHLPTLRGYPCETWDDTEFVQMGFEFHHIHDDFGMLNSRLMLTPRSFVARPIRDGIMALPQGHPMQVIHIVNTILRFLIVILGDPQSLVSILSVAKAAPLDDEQQYPMLALKSALPFCKPDSNLKLENIQQDKWPRKLVAYLLNHGLVLWAEIDKLFPEDTTFRKFICGAKLKSEEVSTLFTREITVALINLAHVPSWHALLKQFLCIQTDTILPGFPLPLDPIASSSSSSHPAASTSSNLPPPPSPSPPPPPPPSPSSPSPPPPPSPSPPSPPPPPSPSPLSPPPPPPSPSPPLPPPSKSPTPPSRTRSVTPRLPSPTQRQTSPDHTEPHTPPPPSPALSASHLQLSAPPLQTASHTPRNSSSSPTPQQPPPHRRLEFLGVELSPMRPSSKRRRSPLSPEVEDDDASSFAASLAEQVNKAAILQRSKGKKRVVDIDEDTRSESPLSPVPSGFEDLAEPISNVDLGHISSHTPESNPPASSAKQLQVTPLAVSQFSTLLNKKAFRPKHNIKYSLALKLLHAVSQLPEDVQLGLEHNINHLPAILQDSWSQGVLSGPPTSMKDTQPASDDEEDEMEMD